MPLEVLIYLLNQAMLIRKISLWQITWIAIIITSIMEMVMDLQLIILINHFKTEINLESIKVWISRLMAKWKVSKLKILTVI